MNILITWYLFGLIGACIISYFDNKSGYEPESILHRLVVSIGGGLIFAYAIWVVKEDLKLRGVI